MLTLQATPNQSEVHKMTATITRNRSSQSTTQNPSDAPSVPPENLSGRQSPGATDGALLEGLIDLDLPEVHRIGAGREPNPMNPQVVSNLNGMAVRPSQWAVFTGTNFEFRSVLKSTADKWVKANPDSGFKVSYITVTADMYHAQTPTGEVIRQRTTADALGKPSPAKSDNDVKVTQIYRLVPASA
jgi:hypothetical protein